METTYTPPTYVLAEVGDRLLAVLIDAALYFVPALFFVLGGTINSGGDLSVASWPLLGLGGLLFLGVLVYQLILLSNQGQTVGKRVMKIKIVRVSDQENGGFVTNVLLRGIVSGLPSLIPILGNLYTLVDILFIFGSERRCIHDLIAGTYVVKATEEIGY